jgi:hypothetical protein
MFISDRRKFLVDSKNKRGLILLARNAGRMLSHAHGWIHLETRTRCAYTLKPSAAG